jgi:hypothetical protein
MSNKKINEDKTISKIDASQLKNSANNIDMTREKDDLSPNNFTEDMGVHYDQRDGQVVRSNPEFSKYSEMSRFNHEIALNGKKIKKDE